MELALPAPPEQLMIGEELAHELDMVDAADGKLPRFLDEQRPPKTDKQIAAEAADARHARDKAADAKCEAGQKLTADEFADRCFFLDPASNTRRRRRPRGGP